MKNYPQLSPVLRLTPQTIMPTKRKLFVRKWLVLSALFLPLISGLPTGASPVLPTNYIATPGEGIAQGGFNNYFDETGGQLTDGIFGADDWSANLGNGIAYEWVGWQVADPVISFQFSGLATITQVGIDFNRAEANMIFLPSTVSIGSTDFTVAPTAIPDGSRGTLFFNGLWVGSTLTISSTDCSPINWTFIDEISFNVATVPEPSVLALLTVGLGCLALRLRRKGVAYF